MAFVKANITLVVCGIVIVLMLAFCVWPTLSLDDALKAKMKDRIDQTNVADNLILRRLEVYPGGPVLTNATVEPNVQLARRRAYDQMKREAADVKKMAAAQNMVNRIIEPGGVGGSDHEIPLLADHQAEDHFLPVKAQSADAIGFKIAYENQFPMWIAKIRGGEPPTTAEVTQLIAQATAEKVRQQAAIGVLAGSNSQTQAQLSTRAQNAIKRAAVYNRAASIQCYVDPGALQTREWYGKNAPPVERQMFEGFVDSWLQQDVINAIATLNNKVLDKQPTTQDKNVGHSAVKRLENITIGNNAIATNAGSGPGPLFMGMVAATPTMNTSFMATAPTGVDFSRTPTGRVGGGSNDYDVALMRIVVDINPAYTNQFIDELYRQNNGYTVINMNMHVVDPLEAASDGFLYGQVQVIRLDLTVEALLFRSWTLPLMPDEIKRSLNITSAPAMPGR